MAIDLDEQDGQTPLDPDEKAGLIPEHLATKLGLKASAVENFAAEMVGIELDT